MKKVIIQDQWHKSMDYLKSHPGSIFKDLKMNVLNSWYSMLLYKFDNIYKFRNIYYGDFKFDYVLNVKFSSEEEALEFLNDFIIKYENLQVFL